MILEQLPKLEPGSHMALMGNTGEGKTVTALTVVTALPNYILLNTKHDEEFGKYGETITDDEKILNVAEGAFDYRPSKAFLNPRNPRSEALKDRFFAWALEAGYRCIYIDEVNDVCPSAQNYPFEFQRCMKQGRSRKLSMVCTAQEIIRAPSFAFSQAQHRYLFFLGWEPHRKLAAQWFQQEIQWDMIPERSHKFYLKTPDGVFGPQPKVRLSTLKERALTHGATRQG